MVNHPIVRFSGREQHQQAFPHSSRVRPADTVNPIAEFCQIGGRRIILLYVCLAILLYMRSLRNVRPVVTTSTTTETTNSFINLTSKQCKTVHFIRHGEGTHNRDAKLYEDFYKGRHLSPIYHDAPLTEAGMTQAEDLYRVLSTHKQEVAKAELIVSSTLRRALQTARAAFPAPKKLVVTDLCRERIALYASDKRRSLGEIAQEFSHIEFSHVDGESDEAFETKKEMVPDPYDSDACKERARRFVDWLVKERPEQSIVVVTHWVFLSHLLKAETVQNQASFENAELRSITLCRD